MKHRTKYTLRNAQGFSLVEVLVALVVCSIGLLGLAKMESLALSSTGVASTRSIAAIQAASLAAAMKSNGAYWASGLASPVTTITAASAAPAVSPNCQAATAGTCAPAQMAAYDLQQWALNLQEQQQLQGFFATITCSTNGFPVTCTIALQWAENAVAANGNQTNMAALQLVPAYTLYVQP
jgi:type IV pilus assembly protein PilV